ncbi:hypothetical protein CRG98_043265 [Punica granatum]|uniref:Uncharacterized protein n=1 Tax=Punica granatum TaxID=22663 RepID=A0A2I0HXB8_PUNGR|nr:hypothetical protein CRG98_043265 [Punica granatum]
MDIDGCIALWGDDLLLPVPGETQSCGPGKKEPGASATWRVDSGGNGCAYAKKSCESYRIHVANIMRDFPRAP